MGEKEKKREERKQGRSEKIGKKRKGCDQMEKGQRNRGKEGRVRLPTGLIAVSHLRSRADGAPCVHAKTCAALCPSHSLFFPPIVESAGKVPVPYTSGTCNQLGRGRKKQAP